MGERRPGGGLLRRALGLAASERLTMPVLVEHGDEDAHPDRAIQDAGVPHEGAAAFTYGEVRQGITTRPAHRNAGSVADRAGGRRIERARGVDTIRNSERHQSSRRTAGASRASVGQGLEPARSMSGLIVWGERTRPRRGGRRVGGSARVKPAERPAITPARCASLHRRSHGSHPEGGQCERTRRPMPNSGRAGGRDRRSFG